MTNLNTDYKWYQPFYWHNTQGNSVPLNTHLVWNTAYNTLYWVDSVNPKLLKKTTDGGVVVNTIVTRSNKNIARAFPDLTNNKIYFIDCEYDNTFSYVWYLDLTDDSIVEIESIPADVFDIWHYGNQTFINYFSTSYELLTFNIDPNDDITTEWTLIGAGDHHSAIDEGTVPNTADYIYTNADNKTDVFDMETDSDIPLDLSLLDSGHIYQITCYVYIRKSPAANDCRLLISGNQVGMTEQTITNNSSTASWKTVVWTGLDLIHTDLDALEITIKSYLTGAAYNQQVYTMYCKIDYYGDLNTSLNIKNLDTLTVYSQSMGSIVGRSWDVSYTCLKSADDQFWFLWKWSNENVEFWRFDLSTTLFTEMEDAGANTDLATSQNQRGIAYDDVDVFYFVLKDTSDNKFYLYNYAVVSDVLTKICEYNIALGLQRNTDNTANPIWNLEKAYDMINDADNKAKIYQISKGKGNLLAIARITVGAGKTIQAITDKYIFLSDGQLYKWLNAIECMGSQSVIRARQKGYWSAEVWINIEWTPKTSHFAWDAP